MSRLSFYKTALLGACAVGLIHGSSHREAPQIASTPKLDGTDFYLFNSYEPGRSNFVTIIANYLPLQDAYGGPNYFLLDTNAIYEIHIDNNGDAVEDLTFRFQFTSQNKNISLPIGPPGNRRNNAIPLLYAGPIGSGNDAALGVIQHYTVRLVRGDRRGGTGRDVLNAEDNSKLFTKPLDNVGNKTIPDYNSYANSYIYNIRIPGCATPGRMFVGQRKDPFVVNLGETFDLVNFANPLGPVDAGEDSLSDKNVTSIILELPKECLLTGNNNTIGAWTTASRIAAGAPILRQSSRLSAPLVNELVIGLKDKDKFNTSEPKNDAQFADYVTHPTLPALIELLFGSAGVRAPTVFPRSDLVAVFLTGIDGLNKNGSTAEMLRLNTSIAATPIFAQNNLGVIAGDLAGFPNGRRPGDDVVDIALRVLMGKLLPADVAPSGQLEITDGALAYSALFSNEFPYLRAPLPGSPNSAAKPKPPRIGGPFQP